MPFRAFRRTPPAIPVIAIVAVIALTACTDDQPLTAPEAPPAAAAARGGASVPLTAYPTALALAIPASGGATVTATVQFVGTIEAASSDLDCATVSPASVPASKPRGSSVYVATFTVTPIGPGSCSITLTDKRGGTAVVSVVVRHAPPADGSRIVFASDREGNFELYSSDPDGSDLLRLTSTSTNELYPAISPDGSKIVYSSDENGTWNLFLADPDGSDRQQLTSYDLGDGFGAVHPTFSPDGQQIAFAFFGGFGSDGVHIQAMAAVPDAVPVALTAGSRDNTHPRYAPDGRIVFASRAEDDLWSAVWIMYGNGASPTQLTGGTTGGEGTPSVSPDGTTIIYARGGFDDSEIWAMDMDGGNQHAVTANDANDAQPSFSPDGAWVAFTSSRGTASDVIVMRLDRPEAEAWNITESAARNVMGDWR